jgi:rhomboid family GlyGly-CTERM serine protease
MRHKETILFAFLIGAANVSLFVGGFSDGLIYLPEKVTQGQWWRLATHPFVHVSFYHLLLDGAAFLMLYAQLAEKRLAKRIGYLLGIHAAVVAAVTWSLPGVQAFGYCGLSGIAHGLMAVWCLERMGVFDGPQACSTDRMERLIAAGVFVGLLAKSIYEVAVGHVVFESTHFGDVGVPVVASHLAGVIGAVIVYAVFNYRLFILKKDRVSAFGKLTCQTS